MAVIEQLVVGTNDTIVSTGSSSAVTNNSLSVADWTVTTTNYPFAEIELTCTYSVAPTASTGISVWFLRRPDGSNWEDGTDGTTTPARAPDLVIPLRAVTTAQRITRVAQLPAGTAQRVLIKNDGTGQTMPAGWGLKGRPFARQGV